MVKNLLVVVLFLLLHLTPYPIYGINDPKSGSGPRDVCSAPPPDSIHISTIGHNFATLAWSPSPLVENYQLTVFKKMSLNDWDSLYSVNLINTTTYTISDLEPNEEYMAGVRSICPNGDPGNLASYSNPIHGIIVELTLGGRRPVNPVHSSCINIDYSNSNIKWIGFKLSKYEEGITKSCLFEVEKIDGDPDLEARIKRINEADFLVAANQLNYWPQPNNPIVSSPLIFKVGEVSNGIFHNFGFLEFVSNKNPLSFNLCVTIDTAWEDLYDFEMLTATKAKPANCIGCPIINLDKFEERSENNDAGIRIQNPFSDHIQLFFSNPNIESFYKIAICDLHGSVILDKNYKISDNYISILTNYIPPGLYIIRIESNGLIQYFKAFRTI